MSRGRLIDLHLDEGPDPDDPADSRDDLAAVAGLWESEEDEGEPDWPVDAWGDGRLRGDPAVLPAGAKVRVVTHNELAARRINALTAAALYRLVREGAA